MKNYMVTHTFKSAEMKKKFTDTVASMKMEDIVKSMKSDNAACQMTDFFTPHKFVECTDQVMDYNA